MNLLDLFVHFLGFWLVVYAVVFLFSRCAWKRARVKHGPHQSSRPSEIVYTYLPTTSLPPHSPTLPSSYQSSDSSQSNLSIKLFSINYTTTWFNPFFLRLAELAPRFWDIWFIAGVYFGLIAMVAGLGVLTFAAYRIGIWILRAVMAVVFASETRTMVEGVTRGRNSLAKRAFESEEGGMSGGGGEQIFVPVIPGITLPLSHIGYYLLALLFSGVFHEAGHAIAAAREHVPINNAGVFLYILYPGAFVDLPERALSLLPPLRRLRVICAGVWHNAVLYVVLWITLSAGLRIGFQMIGWRSLQGEGGVAVVEVSENSVLHDYLPVSSVIYRLDDTYLDRNINDWNDFLLDPNGIHEQTLGFCVGIKEFSDVANDLSCCRMDADNPFGQLNDISFSCFKRFSQQQQTSVHDPQNLACLPTTRILASTPPHERCETNFDCGEAGAGVCMTPYAPYKTGQLLRIYAKRPPWEHGTSEGEKEKEGKSVVFAGELVDVWENVQASVLQPRYSFLPVWLPRVMEMTISYTSSFTLALSLLNILPAFRLDGEYALTAVLSILYPSRDETTSTSGRNTRIRRQIEHSVMWYASALVGFVVVGSIITGVAQTAGGEGGR